MWEFYGHGTEIFISDVDPEFLKDYNSEHLAAKLNKMYNLYLSGYPRREMFENFRRSPEQPALVPLQLYFAE